MQAVCRPCTKQVAWRLPFLSMQEPEGQRHKGEGNHQLAAFVEGKAGGTQAKTEALTLHFVHAQRYAWSCSLLLCAIYIF
jgi:hypothetical protein